MTTALPSTPAPRRLRAALILAAIGLALVTPPSPARAEPSVALGDRVTLAWENGDLDPATLAGTGEQVRVLVDDEPVATIARLTLASRGALAEADFTITALEASDITSGDGRGRIASVTGQDLPLGVLRDIAEEMRALDEPTPFDAYRLFSRVTLGALTVRGFAAADDVSEARIDRLHLEGVAAGRAALVEVEGLALADRLEEVDIAARSVRLTNVSIDPRVFAGADIEDLSVTGTQIRVAIAEIRSATDMETLADGTPYPARATGSATGITVGPGRRPGPEVTGFFTDLGAEAVWLAVEGESTIVPEGPNFAMSSTMALTAQTGDALRLASRWLLPISSWQIFNVAVEQNPVEVSPDTALQLLAGASLVDAEIELTAAGLAEAASASAARDSGLEPTAMREAMAVDAGGMLALLPDGGASVGDAVKAFLTRLGTLTVLVRPAYPVPLSTVLVAEDQAEAIWQKLNVSASHAERQKSP